MILKIECKLKAPLVLPINYQYMVQSSIYQLLSYDARGKGKKLHDEGAYYYNRVYKLFTFGRLHGDLRIDGKKIIFMSRISLEIRSLDKDIVNILSENIDKYGLYLGENYLEPYRLILKETDLEGNKIKIKMDSPITVYRTDENKKTIYYTPWDGEFYNRINDNLKRKYEAAHKVKLSAEQFLKIEPQKISDRDKVITKYKGFYIVGWTGEYQLQGENKLLRFLYDTGLGSKNAQGFGMFRIIDDEGTNKF